MKEAGSRDEKFRMGKKTRSDEQKLHIMHFETDEFHKQKEVQIPDGSSAPVCSDNFVEWCKSFDKQFARTAFLRFFSHPAVDNTSVIMYNIL